MKNNPKINQPKISDETMKEMAKFFMKTSIPRILAEMAKKEGDDRNGKTESLDNVV